MSATDPLHAEPRTDDLVQPFQIERNGLRGRLVRLGGAVDGVLARHDYPDPVARLLGEAMALAACLASSVKYDGIFTLQANGDGPVSMLVTDITSAGTIRGYVGYDRERLAAATADRTEPTVPRLLGGGYLAFTVDNTGEQADGENSRYQGIVALEGASLAECVHHYFRQSEQIETGVKVVCGRVGRGDGGDSWRAAALMVQRLPEQAGADRDVDDEGWRRAMVFLGSATPSELLDPVLTPETLLYRLFHEDGVRVYPPRPVAEGCRCGGRARIETVLRSMPAAEIRDMKIDDAVVVTCEFCGRAERFDDDDLDMLYGKDPT